MFYRISRCRGILQYPDCATNNQRGRCTSKSSRKRSRPMKMSVLSTHCSRASLSAAGRACAPKKKEKTHCKVMFASNYRTVRVQVALTVRSATVSVHRSRLSFFTKATAVPYPTGMGMRSSSMTNRMTASILARMTMPARLSLGVFWRLTIACNGVPQEKRRRRRRQQGHGTDTLAKNKKDQSHCPLQQTDPALQVDWTLSGCSFIKKRNQKENDGYHKENSAPFM